MILCRFVGLAYQVKDIVFRFIIEYSDLRCNQKKREDPCVIFPTNVH